MPPRLTRASGIDKSVYRVPPPGVNGLSPFRRKRTCRMMMAERFAPRSASQCIRLNRRAFAEGLDLEYLYSCALHHNQDLLSRAKDPGTIRGVVVAGRAVGEFDAEPEIVAALRGYTLRGTCTVQACRRNVQFPRLWSNLDSALFCFCVNRSADAYRTDLKYRSRTNSIHLRDF